MIGTQDLSYEFSIMEKYPSFHYKELKSYDQPKNKKINAHFEIEAKSKITRLIAPFYDERAKSNPNIKYKVEYSHNYYIAKIEYSKMSEDNEYGTGYINNIKEKIHFIQVLVFYLEQKE